MVITGTDLLVNYTTLELGKKISPLRPFAKYVYTGDTETLLSLEIGWPVCSNGNKFLALGSPTITISEIV